MKISGFSFIRDGVRFAYPFVQSIRSALPLCDEFVIAVGECDDGTLEQLQGLGEPKLRIIRTHWNEHMRSHGFVYGQQKMVAQYCCSGDWLLYLEGDEVLHEEDIGKIRTAMRETLDDPRVEALAFDYHHFWGEARFVRNTPGIYRKAMRAIKGNVRSYAPDGLYWAVVKDKNVIGRRNKRRTRYPRALDTGIPIYHYGNVRDERYLAPRAKQVNQYWQGNHWFDSYAGISSLTLERFTGSHPQVMHQWLEQKANRKLVIDVNYQPSRRERKHLLLAKLEQRYGWDFSKRHFKLIPRSGREKSTHHGKQLNIRPAKFH